MPRSPLTETIKRAEAMVHHVQENLSAEEYMLFLDIVDPLPEPAQKSNKKKAGKKSAGSGGGGKSSSKSARASGMAKTLNDNLSQRRQETIDDVVERDTGEPARCQFIRADGNPCKLLPDHNIHHMMTANEYHEFQSTSTTTGKSDAQSAAGGS